MAKLFYFSHQKHKEELQRKFIFVFGKRNEEKLLQIFCASYNTFFYYFSSFKSKYLGNHNFSCDFVSILFGMEE